mgnify:FL=1
MKYLLGFLFSVSFSLGFSQQYIHGVVVDEGTGTPVPLANVVLKGSYTGTATNFDGEFVINISDDHLKDTLIISVVGYKTGELPVPDYVGEKFHRVLLKPFVFEMSDVTIETKSLLYNTMIKKAAEAIKDNYHQGPFNYDLYYRNSQTENSKVSKERQAAVRLYDSKGYEQSNTFQVFKERGYDFLQVRRSFELNSLTDGSTQLDDLLEFDIVRHRANVLNTDYIYDDYDVDLARITEVDGDSVFVLKFTCKNPGLSNSGDNYVKKYSGKIYIKKKDNAIIKYEAQYECSNYSNLGRSLYVNEAKQNYKPMTIVYNVTTRYKEFNGAYFLSSIAYERKHKWKHKQGNNTKSETINAELLVTEITVKNPQAIPNRAYYEEVPFDEKFWESFNYLRDEKKKEEASQKTKPSGGKKQGKKKR